MSSSSASRARFFNERSYLGLAISAVLFIVCNFVTSLLHLPDGVGGTVSSIVGLAPTAVALRYRRERTDTRSDVEALSRGQLVRPLPLVITGFAFALFILDSLIGGVIGYLGGLGASTEADAEFALVVGVVTVGIPGEIVAVLFMSRYAARFMGQTPIRWLGVAVAGYLLMRVVVLSIYLAIAPNFLGLSIAEAIPYAIVVAAGMFGICCLGALWARKRQLEFVASRLFRALSDGNKSKALAILRQGDPTAATERLADQSDGAPEASKA